MPKKIGEDYFVVRKDAIVQLMSDPNPVPFLSKKYDMAKKFAKFTKNFNLMNIAITAYIFEFYLCLFFLKKHISGVAD
jgi:hypothetical protein